MSRSGGIPWQGPLMLSHPTSQSMTCRRASHWHCRASATSSSPNHRYMILRACQKVQGRGVTLGSCLRMYVLCLAACVRGTHWARHVDVCPGTYMWRMGSRLQRGPPQEISRSRRHVHGSIPCTDRGWVCVYTDCLTRDRLWSFLSHAPYRWRMGRPLPRGTLLVTSRCPRPRTLQPCTGQPLMC